MSMDAGGLAQMSYPNFPSIGIPGSGFASRGKGAHIKRLSFEPSTPSGSQGNGAPTPRTSRSHLLAGLRTAPKSATTANFPPPSAPPTQLHHRTGLDSSMYSDNKENARSYGAPKTSIGSSFPTHQTSYNPSRQMYSLPEQVLAPPEIQIDEQSQEQMDPNLYAQLVATNMYLAEQQQRLQQQLINVQAAAQQFQGMNLGQMGHQMQQQFATPPITPNMGMYQQQQAKQNMQPIVTPVMGAQPGIYTVYNPMTGQQSYFIDQNAQQVYTDNQQTPNSFRDSSSPPQQPGTPRFQVSPPTNSTPLRSISPPKKSTSPPQDHSPLPPPSANAFRRGHKKASSLANVINAATTAANVETGPRTAIPKNIGIPATPMTGTFGPGQARAGEHPMRQPRGPPSLDELLAKPTTKFEGSKNFATRQRRNAVHNLVRAGMELAASLPSVSRVRSRSLSLPTTIQTAVAAVAAFLVRALKAHVHLPTVPLVQIDLPPVKRSAHKSATLLTATSPQLASAVTTRLRLEVALQQSSRTVPRSPRPLNLNAARLQCWS
jgi:hypothetical protein